MTNGEPYEVGVLHDACQAVIDQRVGKCLRSDSRVFVDGSHMHIDFLFNNVAFRVAAAQHMLTGIADNTH